MDMHDMNCCGLQELDGLSNHPRDPEASFMALVEDNGIGNNLDANIFGCGGFIFTQAGTNKTVYGKNFAKFIEANKLGTVTMMPGFKNPNTGNTIITFLWVINQKGIKPLYNKLRKTQKYRDIYGPTQEERDAENNTRSRRRYADYYNGGGW